MKTSPVKGKNQKELADLLVEKRKKLADFRFNIATGKIKNVKEGRSLRKEIARILTEGNSNKYSIK